MPPGATSPRRWPYLAALILTIGAGLLSLRFRGVFADLMGEALWTVAVYLAARFVQPQASPGRTAVFALAVSFAVEFQQLWRDPWIDSIRRTLPGRLLLGSAFAWEDFGAYLAGAALVLAVERVLRHR